MTRHMKFLDRLLGRVGFERNAREATSRPVNDATDRFTKEVVRLYSQGVGRGF